MFIQTLPKKPSPELNSCSTQLSTKYIMLINVVGILTFIDMINIISERLEARDFFICRNLGFLCAVEISCSVEFSMKTVFYKIRVRVVLATICQSKQAQYIYT